MRTPAIKRVYEPKAPGDGTRVLVDRLWPRGLTKAEAQVDVWLKDVAPSPGLRKWYGHDPERWTEFQRRYAAELEDQGAALEELRALATKGTVTLVYSARDREHNQAVALLGYLRSKWKSA